jgi:hypothetical protein
MTGSRRRPSRLLWTFRLCFTGRLLDGRLTVIFSED